jgi:hypothetical protein
VAFSDEVKKRVSAALSERVAAFGCYACGRQNTWVLADAFVNFSLVESVNVMVVGGPSMPCVALVCSHCGHTVFFNALVLGLQDMLEENSDG